MTKGSLKLANAMLYVFPETVLINKASWNWTYFWTFLPQINKQIIRIYITSKHNIINIKYYKWN